MTVYDKCKDKLIYKVYPLSDTGRFEGVVFKRFMDLTLVPIVPWRDPKGCTLLTEKIFSSWNISKETLFNNIEANMTDPEVREIVGDDIRYVVAIENKEYHRFGAGFIAKTEILKSLEDQYGSFYLLPDSDDYLILNTLPFSEENTEFINSLVDENNKTNIYIDEKNRLVNHAYYFKNGVLYNLSNSRYV